MKITGYYVKLLTTIKVDAHELNLLLTVKICGLSYFAAITPKFVTWY